MTRIIGMAAFEVTSVKYLIIALVLLIVAIYLFARRRQPVMRVGEILPATVMKQKYGLVAENRPRIEIDPSRVPAHLQDLIPMAEEWGVGDDIIRGDIEQKASEEKKNEFRNTLHGRTAQVTSWLDSFDNDLNSANPMTEEAGHFMYMLEALDESGLWPD